MPRPGARNLLTDVPGLRAGQCHDAALRSGVTVILPDRPVRCALDIRGGGPGTRETDTMRDGGTVSEIHGLVLSGGSAFGLDAATGVQAHLRERGIGFAVGPVSVPIVPQAILFDLLNGGNKEWGRYPPYRDMAYAACESAAADFALGTAGAGYGASVAWREPGAFLMGGTGSASLVLESGITIGALGAVNAVGTVTIGATPHFWAAPVEIGGEFGGLGWPQTMPEGADRPVFKGGAKENTTLAVVATDAALSRSELKRLAVMAQTGLARAIYPAQTPLDGDIVFALSTGERTLEDPVLGLAELGALAANTLARAIARGVYEAGGVAGGSAFPSYREAFPRG
jgi:D-aminopeptidase